MNLIYIKTLFALMLGTLLLLGCSGNGGGRDTKIDTATSEQDTGALQSVFGIDPSVPQDCDEVDELAAEGKATTVGCEFYSVSLDVTQTNGKFAIVLANVQFTETANFTVYGSEWDYAKNEGEWRTLNSGTIAPLTQRKVDKDVPYLKLNENLELYTHTNSLLPKAIMKKGAYKIVSDIPIVAYQFNPLDRSGSFSSDASMLMPVPTWSTDYQVVGYHTTEGLEAGFGPGYIQYNLAYIAIVAAENDTVVTINPTATVRAGYENWYAADSPAVVLPGGTGEIIMTLDEADVLYLHADVVGESFSGTTVSSSAPVALFSGHQCALIPAYAKACDNVEEQLPGVEYWGTRFAAARLPNRNRTNHSDPVMWQIYASKDNTQVTITATGDIRGVSNQSLVMNKGELREFYVYGSHREPGDFFIEATEAIAVLQYMTGADVTMDDDGNSLGVGDPTMSYVPPVEQFVSRYIVNVPVQWAADYFVITRLAGEDVYIDNEEIDDSEFVPIGDGEYEAGRILVPDGVHFVETGDTSKKLGLTVAGFDDNDSYAYTGGMGLDIINLTL